MHCGEVGRVLRSPSFPISVNSRSTPSIIKSIGDNETVDDRPAMCACVWPDARACFVFRGAPKWGDVRGAWRASLGASAALARRGAHLIAPPAMEAHLQGPCGVEKGSCWKRAVPSGAVFISGCSLSHSFLRGLSCFSGGASCPSNMPRSPSGAAGGGSTSSTALPND